MGLTEQQAAERIRNLAEMIIQPTGTSDEAATCAGFLDLSSRDLRKYSVLRAINTKLNSILNSASGRGDASAGFEHECHNALAIKLGKPEHQGAIMIPSDVLYRDLNVAVGSAGGFTVGTSDGGRFIDVLRKRSVLFRLGAQRMPGRRDNLAIPRQATDPTITWLTDETTQAAESTPTLTQVAGTPHTAGAYNEWSRKLLQQTDPELEAKVLSSTASAVAVGVDAAGLNGSGAFGQPTGVLQTAGIGTVTGASLAYAGLIEAQVDIADNNAVLDPSALGYATTPTIAQLLKGRQRFTGTDSSLWKGAIHEGEIEGVQALSTKNMPASTMLYGDWSSLIIAEWGTLIIEVNPFTDFKAGIVGIRTLWTIDVLVGQPLSFTAVTSIT